LKEHRHRSQQKLTNRTQKFHTMRILNTIFALFFITALNAQSTQTYFNDANTFFKTYVKNGRVDYKSIKSNPASLNALIESAGKIKVSTSNSKEYKALQLLII